jgi:primosomal protein N' (replication factor Y) (superfamily II helicase)
MTRLFADIILPLAVKSKYTYLVPSDIAKKIEAGSRVVIQFGNRKLYSGVVVSLYEKDEEDGFKTITDLLDEKPLLSATELKFWKWISDYYMCTQGEVMKAALPSALCLESETLLKINPGFNSYQTLDKSSLQVLNIIENKPGILLKDLPARIDNRNTIRIVNELVKEKVIFTGETLNDRFQPGTEPYVILSKKYSEREMNITLDKLSTAPKQYDVLTTYLGLIDYSTGSDLFPVKKSLLLKKASASGASLGGMIKKGIFCLVDLETTRASKNYPSRVPLNILSEAQQVSLESIASSFLNFDTVLLHGVTSSGKTEVYIHLIESYLKQKKQVLYLLPEIALTTQIISRLQKYFGPEIVVYHSRINDSEKAEIWQRIPENRPGQNSRLIVGARSAVFLPFNDLGLVIVDEEHDGSYKQQDPAPRYNARDTAIVLAGLFGAKTLLGSATPSVESYHNCLTGKYSLVELTERYGKRKLPSIKIANVRESTRKKRMVSHFTPELVASVDQALKENKQVILFQNRRGFSPYIECLDCGWIPECKRCSVKLTYHKGSDKLICHYCGYSEKPQAKCPVCHSTEIVTRGFGTEKIEDEVKIIFPDANVSRLDYDTARSKNSLSRILTQFENGQTNILVGTQMVSKGLDFENLAVVGVLNADYMLNFPDFRSWEKGFQLLEQVSGRAGRKLTEGEVIIQTSDPDHPVIQYVVAHDFHSFYLSQTEERKTFGYPPFTRLIRINIRHREWDSLNNFSNILGTLLRESFGTRVLGPEAPVITRIHTWHIKTILIKIEKEKSISTAKDLIIKSIDEVEKMKGASSLKISVDVDPY